MSAHAWLSRHKPLLVIAIVVLLALLVSTITSVSEELGLEARWPLIVALSAVVLLSIPLVLLQQARVRRLIPILEEGTALLNRGEFDEAIRTLEAGERNSTRWRLYHYRDLFRLNLAAAKLLSGEPHQALELVLPLFAARQHEAGLALYYPNMVAVAASAYTLLDERAAAQSLLEVHGPRLSKVHRPLLLAAEVQLLVRRSEYAKADQLVAQEWDAAEAVLPARALRSLRLLQAFSLHRLGEDEAADRLLGSLGPRIAVEARTLFRHLPELSSYYHARVVSMSNK